MAELQAKPLVLVIDDDSWIRSLMPELLASEGFEVLLTFPVCYDTWASERHEGPSSRP